MFTDKELQAIANGEDSFTDGGRGAAAEWLAERQQRANEAEPVAWRNRDKVWPGSMGHATTVREAAERLAQQDYEIEPLFTHAMNSVLDATDARRYRYLKEQTKCIEREFGCSYYAIDSTIDNAMLESASQSQDALQALATQAQELNMGYGETKREPFKAGDRIDVKDMIEQPNQLWHVATVELIEGDLIFARYNESLVYRGEVYTHTTLLLDDENQTWKRS